MFHDEVVADRVELVGVVARCVGGVETLIQFQVEDQKRKRNAARRSASDEASRTRYESWLLRPARRSLLCDRYQIEAMAEKRSGVAKQLIMVVPPRSAPGGRRLQDLSFRGFTVASKERFLVLTMRCARAGRK